MEYKDYLKWLNNVWKETKRVLVPGGRFCLNIAPTGIKDFIPNLMAGIFIHEKRNISQGDYTTYVFEWGYHDFAVKMGLVGLAAYLALIFALVLSAHRMLAENKEKSFEHFFLFGIMFGFIGISAVHFFSPYLNHPLGIGYVLLASTLFLKTRT